MTKFDPKEPVQFRHAPEKVRILATDLKHHLPILIAVTGSTGHEYVSFRHADGSIYAAGEDAYDLVNVPKKHEVWINFYQHDAETFAICAYPSQELANKNASRDRTACVRVEFTEGEGL
jgi:hypothetical protein